MPYKRLTRNIFFVLFILWIVFLCSPQCQAEGYIDSALDKLGRGATDIALSPKEIVDSVDAENSASGIFVGSMVGVVKGLAHMTGKILVGIYQVTTFFLPIEK